MANWVGSQGWKKNASDDIVVFMHTKPFSMPVKLLDFLFRTSEYCNTLETFDVLALSKPKKNWMANCMFLFYIYMIETQLRTCESIRCVGFYWVVNPNLISLLGRRIYVFIPNFSHLPSDLLRRFFLCSRISRRRTEPNRTELKGYHKNVTNYMCHYIDYIYWQILLT